MFLGIGEFCPDSNGRKNVDWLLAGHYSNLEPNVLGVKLFVPLGEAVDLLRVGQWSCSFAGGKRRVGTPLEDSEF
jgi:hypothetical protein